MWNNVLKIEMKHLHSRAESIDSLNPLKRWTVGLFFVFIQHPLFSQLSDLIDYDGLIRCLRITGIDQPKMYIDKSQKSITSDYGDDDDDAEKNHAQKTHIKLHGIFHLIKCINLSLKSLMHSQSLWFA